jgi:hypothetical protein
MPLIELMLMIAPARCSPGPFVVGDPGQTCPGG